ncbi:MAG: sugar phosphate nucleotidyltransferase [Chloroflexota bacterium]
MISTLGVKRPSLPLWGLVLAGGDGRRLQEFIRNMRGEDLPKQYVNFVGRRSMLEHTLDRIEKLIPAGRVFTIVTKHHFRHAAVRRQLSERNEERIVVQPGNKDTLPGILLPLLYIYKYCAEAIVAVFPSDHCILDEDRFMDHVQLAARAVAHDSSQIVLLAVEAQYPEVEYGYVIPRPGRGDLSLWGTYSPEKFVEKPDLATARQLVDDGGLWNTMTMVFKVRTLLDLLQRFCAPTYLRFGAILDAIDTPNEATIIDQAFREARPVNFSKDFLETVAMARPEAIAVLPVLQVHWSDWGSPQRLANAHPIPANLGKPTQYAQALSFA